MAVLELLEKDEDVRRMLSQKLLDEFDLHRIRYFSAMDLSGEGVVLWRLHFPLVGDPDCIFLGEPLTGIDPKAVREIRF